MSDHRSSTWTPVTEPGLSERAVAIAQDVAGRMVDPALREAAIRRSARESRLPGPGWEPDTVASGDAGLALMCGYFEAVFPEQGWALAGHRFLERAAAAAARRPAPAIGLFAGLAGLALAAWSLSRGGDRYRRMLNTLDQTILPRAKAVAASAHAHRGTVSAAMLDAISGLSGVAAYLLARGERPELRPALEAVLGSLAEVDPIDTSRARVDCGLAHGVPGPLAALALALREGVELPGQRAAVSRMCDWLEEQRIDDAWGPNWPTAVPSGNDEHAPSRAAWCYGSPGVARALWLAGDALDRPHTRALATEALRAVHRRPPHRLGIESPSFCHGLAGLLQIQLRFEHDAGRDAAGAAAGQLAGQLLAAYEPYSMLGYRDVEVAGSAVDEPGVLQGAAGVAMVLLATGSEVEPSWDRLFLLS